MLAATFLAIAAQAIPAAAGALPPSTVVDVPQDHGAQSVVITERTIPVGGETGWHSHPGYEICHIVSGTLEVRTATGTTRAGAGETSVIPRGPHDAVNVGTTPARLVITYLVDRGAPVRTDVPAPKG